MSHAFLLVSTGVGSGLTTVSLGLVRALDRLGLRTGFYKPVAQLRGGDTGLERSTTLIEHMTDITTPNPINVKRATSLLGSGQEGLLMEEVVASYRQSAKRTDMMIVEGLVADGHAGYATHLNAAIARALDAEVILVGEPEEDIDVYIDIAANAFKNDGGTALIGVILNKVGVTLDAEHRSVQTLFSEDACRKVAKKSFHFVGAISYRKSLNATRMSDIATYLDAKTLFEGELNTRRARHIELCARTVENTLAVYQPHTLLIFPGDRDDVFIAACMAALNGVPLAGILLTSDYQPNEHVMKLCAQAIQTGLPILQVALGSYQTATKLAEMPREVPIDDYELIDDAMNHVANYLDADWLKARCAIARKPRLSPAAFRYQLLQQSQAKARRIVLPEGEEPRTIKAADQCQRRGIADCILLGKPEKIHQVAASQGIKLDDSLSIINPADVRHRYVEAMLKLRQHKGLTQAVAEDQLHGRIVLGTMMLALDEVDGLVSGASHTTANTVRPAFQLIGTHTGAKLVSSIFFMCLPDQVVAYGDCAINPEPNAKELADIAIQSADSAQRFGIEPRVAMISYSTGESGTGSDVEKVRAATALVRQIRPDLIIDGPLQYDAAANMAVGKSKAPNSQVAGKANVFIFPDLNTGNTTYKAVQRNAHVVSIGPMLQGLAKPVNDLSRGASVEDIVYTIALTAIQAGSEK
ncbi:MAG: phosphate acetyltransferase [Mariprofundaceae bacterium]